MHIKYLPRGRVEPVTAHRHTSVVVHIVNDTAAGNGYVLEIVKLISGYSRVSENESHRRRFVQFKKLFGFSRAVGNPAVCRDYFGCKLAKLHFSYP